MNNYCKIGGFNLTKDIIDQYNGSISDPGFSALTDEVIKELFFPGISDENFNNLKEELFDKTAKTWQSMSEEFIKNHTQLESTDEPPEPTGDPSMDQTNNSKYNAATLNVHKTIAIRFINSAFVLGKTKEIFRDWLFKNCIYDYTDPSKIISTDKISEQISNYKFLLCQKLNEELNLGLSLNDDDADGQNLTKSIQDVLTAAAKEVVKEGSNNIYEARMDFYQLAYFDDLLKELDFVTRDPSVASFVHKKNMYTPKFGTDKIYTLSFSQNDSSLDMDDITTNFAKEFMKFLPQIGTEGTISRNMKIGWDGFQRACTALMQWVVENNLVIEKGGKTKDVYEEITNGNMDILGDAISKFLNETNAEGSIYNTMINKAALRGIQWALFPSNGQSNIPQKIRNLYFNQILKTAKHAYLGYTYDPITKSIDLDLIEDKAVVSESSKLSNTITGRVKVLRQTPELLNSFLDKIDNLNLTDTEDGTYILQFDYTPSSGKTKTFDFIITNSASKLKGDTKNSPKYLWKFTSRTDMSQDDDQDIFKNLVYDLFGYNLGLPETEADQAVVDDYFLDNYAEHNDWSSDDIKYKKNLLDLYATPIGITLVASLQDKLSNDESYKAFNDKIKEINFSWFDSSKHNLDLSRYFKDYDDLAKYLYWCTGYDNKNVVNDVAGNKIPVYALTSAIFQFPSLLRSAQNAGVGTLFNATQGLNPFLGEGGLSNAECVALSPLIRNGLVTSSGKKSASELTSSELLITSAFIDYGQSLLFDVNKKKDNYRAHRLLDGNTIFIQPEVFSDKSQQFIIPIRIPKKGHNAPQLLSDLKTLATDSDADGEAENRLVWKIYQWQKAKYITVINQIISKYQTVYEGEFNAYVANLPLGNTLTYVDAENNEVINWELVKKLDSFIKEKAKNKKLLRESFHEKGIQLVEEIDYTSSGLNKAFIEKLKIFGNIESTKDYIRCQKRILIQDIVDNNTCLYDTAVNVEGIPTDWKKGRKIILYKIYKEVSKDNFVEVTDKIDEKTDLFDATGNINENLKVELNPILNSWLYADGIFTQGFQEIFFGLNENNPNKNKDEGESAISGRLLAHYKRTVPAGSTVHLFQQGLQDGVPAEYRVAVFDDAFFNYATNSTGQVYGKDPHDGGAWQDPLCAIWARNSLGSAAIGLGAAKTIHHDVDANGNGILCKWATYIISNAERRKSPHSKYSMERWISKMRDVELQTNASRVANVLREICRKYGNIYVKNPITGEHEKIDIDSLEGNNSAETLSIDWGGNKKIFPNTVYGIDQLLGGAYIGTLKGNNEFNYAENLQNEILAELLSNPGISGPTGYDADIKERVISYIINKSAMKRGAANVNGSDAFEDEFTTFQTMTLRTKFGGLMMDTEHDIDGTVREMSQIMSSLVQNGYSEVDAKKIYSDIGKIIEYTAKDLFDGVDNISSEMGKIILEQHLISSLKSSKISGVGLADSIVIYGSIPVKDDNGKIQRKMIPFSLADIKNKFLSTVNAYLTNEAIIRRYPGVQSVNTPSRGIIQYCTLDDGTKVDQETAAKLIADNLDTDDINDLCESTGVSYSLDNAVKYAFHPYVSTENYVRYNEIFNEQNLYSKKGFLEFKEEYENQSFDEFKRNVLSDPRWKNVDQGASDNTIKELYDLIHSSNHEIITKVATNSPKFLKPISNLKDLKDLKIGQTIIVKRINSTYYEKIVLECAQQRDVLCNLDDPSIYSEIYKVTYAPEDLKQPQISLNVSNVDYYEDGSNLVSQRETTEWDLDVVRAMYYYRELCNPKLKVTFEEKKQALVKKVFDKIDSLGYKYQFSVKYKELQQLIKDGIIDSSEIQKRKLLILRAYQQEILFQLKQKGFLTSNDEILGFQDAFLNNHNAPASVQTISFKEVTPGEIAISAAYAKEFLLKEGDDLGLILKEGFKFFEKRLKTVAKHNLNRELYDAVLLDDAGNQTIVKIVKSGEIWNPTDSDGDTLFIEDNEGVDKTGINVKYKGAKICSIEDWNNKGIKIGKISNTAKDRQYNIIVLQDINDLALFEKTSLFDKDETLLYYDEKNVNEMLKYALENKHINSKKDKNGETLYKLHNSPKYVSEKTLIKNIKALNQSSDEWRDKYISRRAKLLANNFEKSLLYFGTRIPSQALQSGMALKVVMFVGVNKNQVYIPGAMHWFEGADYDIDKTYMMRLDLTNAKLEVLSNLYQDFGVRCAKLPIPNPDKWTPYTFSTIHKNYLDPNVRTGLKNNNGRYFYRDVHYVTMSALNPEGMMHFMKNNEEMFFSIKKILEDTEKNSGIGKQIVIVDTEDLSKLDEFELKEHNAIIQETQNSLDNFLTKHGKTKMDDSHKVTRGLMNRNVINARDIFMDPVNYLSASDPINFDEIKEYAKHSDLGGREVTVSIWNGSSKWVMQEQFRLGKAEVGIIATAIKTFLIKSNVVNAAILDATELIKRGNAEQALEKLSKYVFKFTNILTGGESIGLLANVNLRPLYETISQLPKGERDPFRNLQYIPEVFKDYKKEGMDRFDIESLLADLSNRNNNEDALMALSALLSAATDNAKELILPKINASQVTIDLFCSMLGSGYSMREILQIFSSPWFTLISTLVKKNLYSQSGNQKTLDNVINFVMGDSKQTLLSPNYKQRFIELLCCKEFLFEDGKFVFKDKELEKEYKDYLENNEDYELRNKGEEKSKNKNEQQPENKNEDEDEDKNDYSKLGTFDKYLLFSDRLLNKHFAKVIARLDIFYAKIEDRMKSESGKKTKRYANDDVEADETPEEDTSPEAFLDSSYESEGDGYGEYGEYGEPDISSEEFDEGYYDPEDMEGASKHKKIRKIQNLSFKDFELDDINAINEYLDIYLLKRKVRNRLGNPSTEAKKIFQRLREITIPISAENRILGIIARCNQGLVSSAEEMYFYVKSIELYFNSKLRSLPQGFKNAGYPSRFSLMEFFSNKLFQDQVIEMFDDPSLKVESNVLRMLRESENFWQMFNIYKYAMTINNIQYCTALTERLCDAVIDSIYGQNDAHYYHKLNETQYRIISQTVTDALNFGFLKSLPEAMRTFNCPKGANYYPASRINPTNPKDEIKPGEQSWTYDSPIKNTSDKPIEIDLGTIQGTATFKRWMETTLLQQLKEKYQDNAFIRSLHNETMYNKQTKQSIPCLTVSLDMTNITKSTKLKSQFESIKKAYDAISNDEIDIYGKTMKIKDAFYIYNIIQNGGKPGKRSFNAFFDKQLIEERATDSNSVQKLHWAYLNVLDNLDDVSARSTFETNFLQNLVKDVFWRFASNPEARKLINSQDINPESKDETITKRITPIPDKNGRIIGYNLFGTSIYFIGGDFKFNLPFMSGVIFNQRSLNSISNTHFPKDSASRIRTKMFLQNALMLTKDANFGKYVKLLSTESDWLDIDESVRSQVQNWKAFIYNNIYYINLNACENITPARVLLPLVSIIANNYKDSNGNYVYKETWDRILARFKNSDNYDYYYKSVFKNNETNSFYGNYPGTTKDILVFAAYLADSDFNLQTLFGYPESIAQTDLDFEAQISDIVTKLLGLSKNSKLIENLECLTHGNLGQLIKNFGPVVNNIPNSDFSTMLASDTKHKEIIQKMIKDGSLIINGNC